MGGGGGGGGCRKKVYRFQLRAKPRNFKPMKVKVGYQYGLGINHLNELLDKTQQVIAQTDHMRLILYC